jgi:hypothetical protein
MKGIRLVLCLLPAATRAADPGPAPGPAVILPDADGVLDIAAAVQARSFDAIPNPFRVRDRPAPLIREVPLVISAVLIPGRPEDASAIVNGRLCSPGETIEGLKLSRIGAESLELQGEGVVLHVPVEDRPPKLRLSSR